MDFIVKQALGGATKDLNKMMDSGSENTDPKHMEAVKEHKEAMKEQEEERKAKFQEREAEREQERQKIRDKYGLKSKGQKEAEDIKQLERVTAITGGEAPSKEEAGMLDQAEKSFTELQEKVSNAASQCTIS